MTFVFMLIGALLGAFVCAGVFREPIGLSAAAIGAFIGLLLAQLARLRQRLIALERELAASREAAQRAAPAPARAERPTVAAPLATDSATATAASVETAANPAAASAPAAMDALYQTVVSAPLAAASDSAPVPPGPVLGSVPPPPPPASIRTPVPPVRRPLPPSQPDPLALAIRRVTAWFTEGNVPVKVGVIVTFLGVGALLKYLTDAGLLRMPVEFRLAGIALVALVALVFAWRKRESKRAFALSLQGGAIGVLILTIFAAFRLYALLPAPLAFGLLIVVVAGAGMLAVLQDALWLAVLAILGGFLAPILISTGSGNHVALFSYYAVLNAAVFAIAWVRPWRGLNLLGFAFTFGIGTFWGVLSYKPELFASTEPFLVLFFAFYLFIPLLYARRLPADKRDLIDGTLVFGTPLVVFALQSALLLPERMPLAFSALALAAVYTALAWLELRRLGWRLLGESHALLALTFATLAVPLALSARVTASTWAVEGAALVWLGLRQQRRVPRWIGYGLQVAAACAFVSGYAGSADDVAVLNGAFFGAFLIAVAGLVSARLVSRVNAGALVGTLLFLWGWAWWLFAGGEEIERFARYTLQADWWLALIAVSGVIGAELHRRLYWRECAWPALALFALAPPLIVATAIGNHGALEDWGAAAWALWFVCALRSLVDLVAAAQRFVYIAHFVFLASVALVLGVELGHVADAHLALGDVWVALAALAPLAALFWCVLVRVAAVCWPDAALAQRTRFVLLACLSGVLALAWFAGLFVEGDPAPLPYLPLFNPLELAQVGFLLLLLTWYRYAAAEGGAILTAEARARVLAVAGIVLLTAVTLRGAHFLGAVPWGPALLDSSLAQAALSISWTLAGVATMLLGKRRGSRAVYIGGELLMGAVLVKLALIDRHFLKDLSAIVAFFVVGFLLIGVGYFAPIPPRAKEQGA